MGLEIRLGETLDGQEKALPGMLVSAPDLRDHRAMVVFRYVEETHPVYVALADLQTFPVQAGTVRDVQMVGIRQESLYLFVKVNVRPVAIEF
jgi:hypothetical protein